MYTNPFHTKQLTMQSHILLIYLIISKTFVSQQQTIMSEVYFLAEMNHCILYKFGYLIFKGSTSSFIHVARWQYQLLHTHIYILNLISLKNVTWHLTFRYINRWTLCRMVISTAREVISTARDNCIILRDDFILRCEIKYRRTEYESSLGICCQISTRPNNYGTV